MNYKVLCSPTISESEFAAIKTRIFPRIYDDRDDALAWCRDVTRTGNIAWSIEGDDGSYLTRWQIIEEIKKRAHELTGRPKKYG